MAPFERPSVTVLPGGPTWPSGSGAGRTVVCLRGEHDAFTAAELSEALTRATALDEGDLVVDLGGVTFMAAATVGVVLRARALLRLRSRSLVVRSPSACARRILDLCGVADLLGFRPGDAAPAAGPAGALGTWVAVPATDRVDGSSPTPVPVPVPGPAEARVTTMADRAGP
jgi:anti-anti-sigma factor